MSSTDFDVKKFQDKLKEEFGKVMDDGKVPPSTPEPAEPKEPLFKKVEPVSNRGKISFGTLHSQVNIPSDKNIYISKKDVYKDDHWHEDVRGFIPEKMDGWGIDPDLLLIIHQSWTLKKPLQITGYPGASKDYTIRYYCSVHRIPYFMDIGMDDKTPHDIVGSYIPQGGGEYFHEIKPLYLLGLHGGVYVDSEPYVNPSSVNFCKQRLTDSDRVLYLSGCPDPQKIAMVVNPEFAIMATTNVRGTGDNVDQYSATLNQDISSINRYALFYHADYLNPSLEIQLLTNKFPTLEPRLIKKLVQMGNLVRQAWKQRTVELPWSVRQLLSWADSCVRYNEPVTGFKECYFNVLNEVEQDELRKHWRDVDFEEYKL